MDCLKIIYGIWTRKLKEHREKKNWPKLLIKVNRETNVVADLGLDDGSQNRK